MTDQHRAVALERASNALQLGRPETAAEVLRSLITQDPSDGLAHSLLSYALIEDPEARLHHADTAVALAPESYEAQRALALAHRSANRHTHALGAIQQMMAFEPNRAEPFQFHAETLAAAAPPGFESQALASANRSIQLDPGDPDAWFALGRVHAACNDGPSATASLRRAIELDPLHRRSKLLLAELEAITEKMPSALELIRSMIGADPTDEAALSSLDRRLDTVLADLLWLVGPIAFFTWMLIADMRGLLN